MFGTGGYGRAFRVTTNAFASTGDGVVMAYRAGIPLEDMEFVQFHPTGLAGFRHPALRSRPRRGRPHRQLRRLPLHGELRARPYGTRPARHRRPCRAVRDRSWARSHRAPRLRLHGPAGQLARSASATRCPRCCISPAISPASTRSKRPVPIQPTAHYSMGGIPCDINGQVRIKDLDGAPEITGFFAAGEASCVSVHGANRLGTNSLLEAVVMGRRAGRGILDVVHDLEPTSIDEGDMANAIGEVDHFLTASGTEKVGQDSRRAARHNDGQMRRFPRRRRIARMPLGGQGLPGALQKRLDRRPRFDLQHRPPRRDRARPH